MTTISSIMPITDLRQNAASALAAIRNSGEPLVITQRGRAAAVLLSVEAYERGERERTLLRLLAKGEVEIRQGKGNSLKSVLAKADRKLRDAGL
jgi:prevent-host-death family protein